MSKLTLKALSPIQNKTHSKTSKKYSNPFQTCKPKNYSQKKATTEFNSSKPSNKTTMIKSKQTATSL
jgi:hypothetical protein